MTRAKGGLGRGLGALIPLPQGGVEELDLDSILPNPRQPRSHLEPEALAELTESIRQHGVLQPILVSELEVVEGGDTRYRIIAGQRRFEAARKAGLTRIPALVKGATPREALELALVENLQRADLNPLEEAQAYQQLIQDFGLTQEEVAQRVGRSRPTIANALRLLHLGEEAKGALERGEISEGHARALLGLPDVAQHRILEHILGDDWSVRQTEEAARLWREGKTTAKPRTAAQDVEGLKLEERLRQALGTKVRLIRGRKEGRLLIYFYSDEELEGLCRRLLG